MTASGHEVPLVPGGDDIPITWSNRHDYVRLGAHRPPEPNGMAKEGSDARARWVREVRPRHRMALWGASRPVPDRVCLPTYATWTVAASLHPLCRSWKAACAGGKTLMWTCSSGTPSTSVRISGPGPLVPPLLRTSVAVDGRMDAARLVGHRRGGRRVQASLEMSGTFTSSGTCSSRLLPRSAAPSCGLRGGGTDAVGRPRALARSS